MRSARSIVGGLIVVAVLLLSTSPATAQGTSGAVPSPINSRQLMRYADRLGLSGEQRRAFEALHDEYRREFRLLRDGEIARFLEEAQGAQGGVPERELIDDLLDQRERIEAKIAAIDGGLFDRLLPMLSAEQQAVLPRVRLARQRARYEPQQTAASYGRRTVDLSDLVADTAVPAEVADVVDSILGPYERRLTQLMARRSHALQRLTIDLMDGLAERGYVNLSQEQLIGDPDLLRKLLSDLQEIYIGLNEENRELIEALADLNARTYRRLVATMPPPAARRLRNAYHRAAYPRLGAIAGVGREDWMTGAAERDGLSDDERAELAVAGAELQRTVDRLLGEGVEIVDGFWRDFSPFNPDPQAASDMGSAIDGLVTTARDTRDDLAVRLEETIGAERLGEIRRAAAAAADDAATEPVARAAADGAGVAPDDEDDDAFVWSGDRFLPSPITRREMRTYLERLGLDDALRSTLHDDYVARYRAIAALTELEEARSAFQTGGEAASDPAARLEAVNRLAVIRRTAVDAIHEVDESFFDDLRVLAPDGRRAAVDRLRRHRHRRIYAGGASARFALGRDRSSESAVDVAALVFQRELPEVEAIRIDAVLADYEARALDAFRSRLDAQLDQQRLSDRWALEIEAAAREDVTAVVALQQRYREIMSS
jgi:hypothetical protein